MLVNWLKPLAAITVLLGFILHASAVTLGLTLQQAGGAESYSGNRLWASKLSYNPGTVIGDSEVAGLAKQAYKDMVEDYNAKQNAAPADKKQFWSENNAPGAMTAFAVGDNTVGYEIYLVSSIKGLRMGESFVYGKEDNTIQDNPVQYILYACQAARGTQHKKYANCAEILAVYAYFEDHRDHRVADISHARIVTWGDQTDDNPDGRYMRPCGHQTEGIFYGCEEFVRMAGLVVIPESTAPTEPTNEPSVDQVCLLG